MIAITMKYAFGSRSLLWVLLASVGAACRAAQPPHPAPARAVTGDAAFTDVAHQFLEDLYRRNPTEATSLGIHKYDDQLENYSKQAVADAVASLRTFRDRVSATDAARLSASNQLDREQPPHAIDSRLITLGVVRPWAEESDPYT